MGRRRPRHPGSESPPKLELRGSRSREGLARRRPSASPGGRIGWDRRGAPSASAFAPGAVRPDTAPAGTPGAARPHAGRRPDRFRRCEPTPGRPGGCCGRTGRSAESGSGSRPLSRRPRSSAIDRPLRRTPPSIPDSRWRSTACLSPPVIRSPYSGSSRPARTGPWRIITNVTSLQRLRMCYFDTIAENRLRKAH